MRIRADNGPHSVIEVVHGEEGTLEAEVVSRVGTMEHCACSLIDSVARVDVRNDAAEVAAVQGDTGLFVAC